MRQLVGFVDRVDEGENGLVVVDYKSGQKKPSPKEASEDLQLTIYAFAVRETLGLPVETVEFQFLRDGSAIGAHREPAAFDWLLGEVLTCAEKCLKREEFLPSPGYWCRWCDCREICEAEGFEITTATVSGGETNGLRR